MAIPLPQFRRQQLILISFVFEVCSSFWNAERAFNRLASVNAHHIGQQVEQQGNEVLRCDSISANNPSCNAHSERFGWQHQRNETHI